MQPETSQKPVMDVKAPPAKQTDEPAPSSGTPSPQAAPAPLAKKPAVKQKQPTELPVMTIVLTVFVMLALSGLSVVVYMKSH